MEKKLSMQFFSDLERGGMTAELFAGTDLLTRQLWGVIEVQQGHLILRFLPEGPIAPWEASVEELQELLQQAQAFLANEPIESDDSS